MKRKRLPEIDELYRNLIKEKNKLNNLDYFMTVIVNPDNKNKIVQLDSEYIWTDMDTSTYLDNSSLIKNLRTK